MRRVLVSLLPAALVSFALTAALAAAGSAGARDITPAPAFSAEDLLVPPRGGWLTNGGNLYNQRYSPLDQIDRDNVSELRAVWRTSLRGSGVGPRYSAQAQTLFHEGVLYVVTGDNDVFAVDVDSGEILWEYAAELDQDDVLVCCGWVSRGLGLGDGKIFLGRLDAQLMALDQRTGEVVWTIQAENPHEGFSITSAPLYYDGMVITGFAGAEYGIRGRVKAYDANDGSLLWTFYTIPAPGEFGSETWPSDSDAWTYGGASVWQTPAVDPELGLVYFATGNPGPDLAGGIRPGDNLFTVSVVALDVATGEYRWHFQQVRHDIWDYDSANPVVLFDAEIDGEMRRGLASIPKSGYLYILDRVTGEPLLEIEDVPVPQEPRQATAATQPIPVGDEIVPHRIDIAPEGWELVNEGRTFTPFAEDPVLYTPLGGVNWPPSSYDPQSHLLFVCATDRIGGARLDEPDEWAPDLPSSYMGGSFVLPQTGPNRGIFAAMDLTTHRLAWRQQWSDRCFSGSVATGGGLVFVGRNDGRLTALDSSTGMRLWEFQTDAGVNTTATVFEHEGTQYVAVLAGGTLFAGSRRGDGLWLFSLDGTIDPLDPAVLQSAAPGGVEVPQLASGPADVQSGRTLYQQACMPCHGESGTSGAHGQGAVLSADLTMQSIATVVVNGRDDMPSFRGVYTAEDLRDIAAYITQELFGN